jgi:hypothetical protein
VCGEAVCPQLCTVCFAAEGDAHAPADRFHNLRRRLRREHEPAFLEGRHAAAVGAPAYRFVELQCCGGIFLAGDLDDIIEGVAGSIGDDGPFVIGAPSRCPRCDARIRPAAYRRQSELLRRHEQNERQVAELASTGYVDDRREQSWRTMIALAADHAGGSRGELHAVAENWRALQGTLPDAPPLPPRRPRTQDLSVSKQHAAALARSNGVNVDYAQKYATYERDLEAYQSQVQTIQYAHDALCAAMPGVSGALQTVLVAPVDAVEALAVLAAYHLGHVAAARTTGAGAHRDAVYSEIEAALASGVTDAGALCRLLAEVEAAHDFERVRRVRACVNRGAKAISAQFQISGGTPPNLGRDRLYSEDAEGWHVVLLDAHKFAIAHGGKLEPNPCLRTSCSSVQRFHNGVRDFGESEGLRKRWWNFGSTRTAEQFCGRDVYICFHGTGHDSVHHIACRGFDVTKRGHSGQAYGPGEYFSTNFGVSNGYARGSGAVFICAVVDSDRTSHHTYRDGTDILVTNDTADAAVAIPLGVFVPDQATSHSGLAHPRLWRMECAFPQPAEMHDIDALYQCLAAGDPTAEERLRALETQYGLHHDNARMAAARNFLAGNEQQQGSSGELRRAAAAAIAAKSGGGGGSSAKGGKKKGGKSQKSDASPVATAVASVKATAAATAAPDAPCGVLTLMCRAHGHVYRARDRWDALTCPRCFMETGASGAAPSAAAASI